MTATEPRWAGLGAAETDHLFTGEDGPVTLDELFAGTTSCCSTT